MSSPAFIGLKNEDETVSYISLHTDGDIQWAGNILTKHYRSRPHVQELIELGNLSRLGADLGEKHSFDDHLSRTEGIYREEWDNWCLSFKRDPRYVEGRSGKLYLATHENENEDYQVALSVEDYMDAADYEDNLEAVYLFTDGGWYALERNDFCPTHYDRVKYLLSMSGNS